MKKVYCIYCENYYKCNEKNIGKNSKGNCIDFIEQSLTKEQLLSRTEYIVKNTAG